MDYIAKFNEIEKIVAIIDKDCISIIFQYWNCLFSIHVCENSIQNSLKTWSLFEKQA